MTGVVGAFANDRRVLAWDVWNEPDNTNGSSYKAKEPANKEQLVLALLPKVFAWARSGQAVAAAHERRVARRLVDRREDVADGRASRSPTRT